MNRVVAWKWGPGVQTDKQWRQFAVEEARNCSFGNALAIPCQLVFVLRVWRAAKRVELAYTFVGNGAIGTAARLAAVGHRIRESSSGKQEGDS